MIDFKADLEPEVMFERGVFGGSYFEMARDEDYAHMRPSIVTLAMSNCGSYDKKKNLYLAKAGQDYAEWMRKGWIFEEDPLGWFHWYCRYSSGRRHERDAHQIARYHNYRQRWGSFAATQVRDLGDASAVVKQGLLQWGIDWKSA